MTMYLSVTPHIQPTHTMWRGGDRMPHRFVPASAYDQETDTTPFEDAVKRLVDNAEARSPRRPTRLTVSRPSWRRNCGVL